MPSLHKPLHSNKPAPSVHKKPMAQKWDDRESRKGNVIAKKPQIKQQPAKLPPSAQQKERPKKRPVRSYSDDEEDVDRAISMIRSMFRYNPYRGVNDDDDSDMEAGFDDIMMEEKRRSVKLQNSLHIFLPETEVMIST